MKNPKLAFFFVVGILMILSFPLLAQDASAVPAPGLFAKISTWLQSQAAGVMLTFVCGFMAKGGYTAIVKKIAAKGAVLFTNLEHFSGDAAALCNVVDKSIKDDNSVDQNSIKEVIAAGKQVIVDTKEMTAVFTPKPAI